MPEILPQVVIDTRHWLMTHGIDVYKADKGLGWVIAKKDDVKMLLYNAFEHDAFVRANYASVRTTWGDLRDIVEAVWRERSTLPHVVLPVIPEVPRAVPCFKVHKLKMRQVIACGSRGVNRLTGLVLQLFKQAADSPATFRSLQDYSTRLQSLCGSLVVGDAASMYLQIPHNVILDAIADLCNPTGLQMELLRRLLKMTFFTVCGQLKMQRNGVFMGMGCAPLLACSPYVREERRKPTCTPAFTLLRYMDDVIAVCNTVTPQLLEFYGSLPMDFEELTDECVFAGLRVRCNTRTQTTVVTAEIRDDKRLTWIHKSVPLDRRAVVTSTIGLLRSFFKLSTSPLHFLTAASGHLYLQLLRIHGFSPSDVRSIITIALSHPLPPPRPTDWRVRLPYTPTAGGNLNRNLLFRCRLVMNLSFDDLCNFVHRVGKPFLTFR